MQQKQQISYLDQQTAQQVDIELMNELGFSLDILMELAGQSISHSVQHANNTYHNGKLNKYLVLCGVGNNGGDGIVAARHLKMMGNQCEILIFREPSKELFINLLKTCSANEIIVNNFEKKFESEDKKTELIRYFSQFDMLIDGIFGFSFKPPVRKPYDQVLDSLKQVQSKIPIFSIDIPSGWDVEKGNIDNQYFTPDYLISLTLPKLVAKQYGGKHYLGGRFIPLAMQNKYKWDIPEYQNDKTFIPLN